MAVKSYVDIHGRNKTDQAFRKVQGNLSKMDAAAGKLSRGLGALGGGVALAGLFKLGGKSLEAADKIHKLSIRLGASAESLSQYRNVADKAGVSFDTLTMGWQRMTRRVAEAAQGTGEAQKALVELGIEAKTLNQLAPDKQFETLADALHKVKNPADQVRLAMKLFDSEGVSLIQTMQGGAESIRKVREESIALGDSLTGDQVAGAAAARDAIDDLTKMLRGGASSAFVGYSEEIKATADFTREYLPKAIHFLMDMLRSLKLAFNAVVLNFQTNLKVLFELASKLPLGVGDKFKGLAETYKAASEKTSASMKETAANMGKWMDSGKELNNGLEDLDGTVDDLGITIHDIANPLETVADRTKRLATEAKEAAAQIKELEKFGAEFKKNIPTTAADSFATALGEVRSEASAATRAQIAFDTALTDGTIKSTKEAAELAGKLGIEYETLGAKSETVQELMLQGWKDLQTGIQSSFYNALRSGEDFFDSLKNIAFDILAQIAAKIATTFVINNLLGGGTGGLWGSALTAVVGGGSGGGGGGGYGSAISTALTGTKLGSYLGAGSGTGTLVGNGINSAFGGASGSTVVGNYINSAFGTTAATGALATGGTAGVTTATGVSTALAAGYTGSAVALGAGTAAGAGTGAFLSGSAAAAGLGGGAAAGGAAAAGAGTSSAAAGLSATGYGAIVVAVVAAVAALTGNSRTPQELANDQLQSVDTATRQGRNVQVRVGDNLSFLGGIHENTVFFGLADKTKSELEKIANYLKEHYDYKSVLAVKDGVLRTESLREFSTHNEQIVNEIQTAIEAVSKQTEDAANRSLENIGLGATKLGGVFDELGNESLASMGAAFKGIEQGFVGVGDVAVSQAGRIGTSVDSASKGITRLEGETSGVINSVDRLIGKLDDVVTTNVVAGGAAHALATV